MKPDFIHRHKPLHPSANPTRFSSDIASYGGINLNFWVFRTENPGGKPRAIVPAAEFSAFPELPSGFSFSHRPNFRMNRPLESGTVPEEGALAGSVFAFGLNCRGERRSCTFQFHHLCQVGDHAHANRAGPQNNYPNVVKPYLFYGFQRYAKGCTIGDNRGRWRRGGM